MAEALRLAERGRDSVSPNPMVGALVVRGERVVGSGRHRRWGGPHAEVEALRVAGARARGADLYVTLEPCTHHGKTGPCTEAIARAGIRRVFFGASDTNPLTAGRARPLLARAGIAAAGGLLAGLVREQNRAYFHWRATGRPWVILKWAMTLDGKIGSRTGESKWITGPRARAHAHRLRRRACAVLAGTTTLLRDDPLLLPRPARGRLPARVILDRRGRLPLSLRLLAPRAEGRRIYVVSPRAPARRVIEARRRGLEVLAVPVRGDRLHLGALLDRLGRSGIAQLLVEGGGELIGGFLDLGLAQEVAAFVAPVLLGGKEAPGPAAGKGIARLEKALRLEEVKARRLGGDILIEGFIPSRPRS
jgi:diaminohydroxyphosphoribosylaminopyrimidine deaminase/5-amino-6-(5-phosphoribosylamino)uracil reductase